MTRYVCFLRGINVGGRVVKMADLKSCFETAGYEDVSTLLQSGNVLLTSGDPAKKLKAEIEERLTKMFRYDAHVQVMKLSQLGKIVEAYPFSPAIDTQHDYVVFFENGLEKEVVKENYDLNAREKVAAGAGAIYWQVDKGQTLESAFGKVLSKSKYKAFNTNRNLKTLRKLIGH